jgi:hypothetical protein
VPARQRRKRRRRELCRVNCLQEEWREIFRIFQLMGGWILVPVLWR